MPMATMPSPAAARPRRPRLLARAFSAALRRHRPQTGWPWIIAASPRETASGETMSWQRAQYHWRTEVLLLEAPGEGMRADMPGRIGRLIGCGGGAFDDGGRAGVMPRALGRLLIW